MNFPFARFAVHRWQFTLIAIGLLLALGLNAAIHIPRSEDPLFPVPVVLIRAVLPGAEPLELERSVAAPIEQAIGGLDAVEEVNSTSRDGSVDIVVNFNWGVDPERKYDEVVREVNAIRGRLPASIATLDVQRIRTSNVLIVQAALVSDVLPMRNLEKLARRLTERLEQTPGVRDSAYWGAPPSEVGVSLDLRKLAALRLPASAVADALKANGDDVPVGAVEVGRSRFTVRAGGTYRDLDTIRGTAIRASGGQVIHVGDVATVDWLQPDPTHLTRFNGRRAVFITVTQKDHDDATAVTRRVKAVLDEYEKTLPGGVKLERAFFQSDNIAHRLNHLYRDLAISIVLVLLTLLPLGPRAGLVVMASVPTSMLAGLLLLDALGYTLNQLTIAGFILALGLLVDDSIVITENIARRMRSGESRLDASVLGTRQMAWAVVGCTATLMFAFLPLVVLPAAPGAYIRGLPIAVLCTVGASLVVALTITPFLASRVLARHADADGNPILRRVNGAIHAVYAPVLEVALRRPWAALAALFLLCATTIPLLHGVGFSLFPGAETPQFLVRVETARGSSMAQTDEVLRKVEARLQRDPEVRWRASNLGRGNPQAFYNERQHLPEPSFAEVFVSLKAWRPGASERRLETLRRDLAAIPGARIEVHPFKNGPAVVAPIALYISGPDLDTLRALADRAEQLLAATPGARDIDNPLRLQRTDLDLGIDDGKAAALGAPAGAARRIARLALTGEDVSRFHDADGDDYPVKVRLPMGEAGGQARNLLGSLADLYVPTADGASTPLASIAAPTLHSAPARIDRRDRVRNVTVTAQVGPGYQAGAVTRAALAKLRRELVLPPGYRWTVEGEVKSQSDSFTGLLAASLIAILGIVAVLVLEFGNFRTALAVAGIIPFGVFGAVAALWITGYPLSFTAAIGIVALLGIEIKNSILLVDFTEQMRREGMGIVDAVRAAAEVRFLPVLLTSVTAIGGLTPLAFEQSGLYSPLAVAIIGGLVSSTLLARLATPVMYLLICRNRPVADPAQTKAAPIALERVPG